VATAHDSVAAATVGSNRRRRASFQRRETLAFYGFISPWLLGFVLLSILPLALGFAISLTNFNGFNLHTSLRFVGTANYARAFHDRLFWQSLERTGTFVLIVVPATLAIQLALAMLLNSRVKLQGVWRTLFYIPAVIPIVAAAYIWKALTAQDGGLVNRIVGAVGGPSSTDWLVGHPTVTLLALMLWGSAGIGMLIFLAGLQSIPEELYEAARIDGASRLAVFREVTLPLLTPVIMFQLIWGLIRAAQVVAEPILLSPNTTAGLASTPPEPNQLFNVQALQQIFVYGDYGYGAAMIWIFVVVLLAVTAALFFSGRFWVYYGSEQYSND
jgi:multiple sugar transport system permease protein